MARLGISYELLARESEILHLHFWDLAFAKLKEAGAIQYVQHGKMAGCWVMPWREEGKDKTSGIKTDDTESQSTESVEGTEEDENTQDKIIVRSNGTVTYVGKDIAYQLWKFGLLGKDFHYAKWPNAPEGEEVWATTSGENDPKAPPFGAPAKKVYNVIDTRQAYLQDVVAQGLRGLGHAEAAENSIHLSYEIVALTPRCAAEMGYELSPDDAKKPYVEVSGRKGFGVKADDLIDRLEAAALAEVQQRHAGMSAEEQKRIAHGIAVGALRFFLLKFTRSAIIAFDFKDALSFEGETGPYLQYAVVRANNIFNKLAEREGHTAADIVSTLDGTPAGELESLDCWGMVFEAARLDDLVEQVVKSLEFAGLAKYAFGLAQMFNAFYHRYPILNEERADLKRWRAAAVAYVRNELTRALGLMGIEVPARM
jgi:arginyl-tRNA synthetase